MFLIRWISGLFALVLSAAGLAGSFDGLWLESAGQSQAALTLSTEVDIEVTGLLSHTVVHQRFRNPGTEWAEGRFAFPLPDDSAVESLTIVVGDRHIKGEIQPREAAAARFEQARSQGRVAGLVEQGQGNVFTTRIANIPPGETVEVVIGYRERVRFEHQRFSLRFPAHRVAGEFDLRVHLYPGLDLASVEASYHQIQSVYHGDHWQIDMLDAFEPSARDFELVWRAVNASHTRSAVFRQSLGGQDHALLMLMPPATFNAQATPRELILVIDTSGSMRGQPIIQAREALHRALDGLKPGDRFNVIEFNHLSQALFDAPRPADRRHLLEARRFVNRLEAGGGTVMGPPLEMAMQHEVAPGYLRQIVFATDGMIADEQAVIDLIRQRIDQSRLFTVGIGHGVNSRFLRDAARLGRGSYTGIAELDEIDARMADLLRQLSSPVLTDIELHWPVEVDMHPRRLPDLYAGQPLEVAARANNLRGEVLVTALLDGQAWQASLPLDAFQTAPGVAAHWAQAAISDQLDQRPVGSPLEVVREPVVSLALEYQLLSPFTSLVAVERTPIREPDQGLVGHDLGGDRALFAGAQHLPMPATDAGSEHPLLRGLLALLLIGLLIGHKRISRDDDEEYPS
ncbi:MAG: VIT domain-containing protein [Wenzhouxiangella sp.]